VFNPESGINGSTSGFASQWDPSKFLEFAMFMVQNAVYCSSQ
jgi:hypothetical protein